MTQHFSKKCIIEKRKHEEQNHRNLSVYWVEYWGACKVCLKWTRKKLQLFAPGLIFQHGRSSLVFSVLKKDHFCRWTSGDIIPSAAAPGVINRDHFIIEDFKFHPMSVPFPLHFGKYFTVRFVPSPQAPPPPEQSWEEKPSHVSHLGSEDFREALKKKKHALVMFYAPCKTF